MQNPQDVKLAAEYLQKRLPKHLLSAAIPPCGVILGTGLSGFLDNWQENRKNIDLEIIPFTGIPHLPGATTESHRGAMAFTTLDGMPVYIQQGRWHLYEGYTPAQVCMGVRIMASLGCKNIIITNAAGALNPLFERGTLMVMADIINYTGQSPLTGTNAFGERFPDMSQPFAPHLRQLARNCALTLGIPLEQGVYIGVHGPEMETPAETRMYRQWGADAVGMSTALEVIAARQMGLDILGISCLTNKNLPDCMVPAPIEEVIAVAQACGTSLSRLLDAVLMALASSGAEPC